MQSVVRLMGGYQSMSDEYDRVFATRSLIYVEDDQGYHRIPVYFRTDCNLTTEAMEKISYKMYGAGRFSTPFRIFKELMEKEGWTVVEESRREDLDGKVDWRANTYDGLEVIQGATGNY